MTLAAARFFCPGSISAHRARVTTVGCSRIASTSCVTLQVFDVQEGTYELHKLDQAPAVDKAFWLLPSNPHGD